MSIHFRNGTLVVGGLWFGAFVAGLSYIVIGATPPVAVGIVGFIAGLCFGYMAAYDVERDR